MYSISFCTSIRNRLHHLRQTLPQNISDNEAYPHLEFVILDYNSSDGLEEWMNKEMATHLSSGRVVYRRTTEPAYFHRSHARNLAFNASKSELVCNIDADNFTGKGFARYIDQMFNRDNQLFLTAFSSSKPNKPDFLGRICCKKRDFDLVGGYNELMEGYGFEDYELISKLRSAGLREVVIEEVSFFHAITHDDIERISEEKTLNLLKGLYLSFVTPSKTDLLYLFNNGTFSEGRLIDQTTLYSNRIEHVFQPKSYDYEFTLEKSSWTNGTWEQDNTALLLTYSSGSTEQIQGLTDNKLQYKNQVFTKTDDKKLVTNLIMFYTQFTNRNWIKKAEFIFNEPLQGLQAGKTAMAETTEKEALYRKLRTSIFYSRASWHVLLQELIMPLTTTVKERDARASAIIHFSEDRGQSVGITWLLSVDTADQCLKYIHEEVALFLKQHPSNKQSNFPDTHTTFKNFDQNSISFNLYPYPFFKTEHLDTTDFVFLSTRLTAIINEVLIINEIDRDATFTFAFYLHVLLIKAFSQQLGKKTEAVLAPLVQAKPLMGNDLNTAFLDNRELFSEIISELNNDDFLKEPANQWMYNWLQACHEVMKRKNANQKTATENTALLSDISMLILEHLSLNLLVQEMIITFISKIRSTQPLIN